MLAAERGAAAQYARPPTRGTWRTTSRSSSETGASPIRGGPCGRAELPRAPRGARAKGSSAARRLSAVRQFHKFLYLEGYAGADPTAADRGAEARTRAAENAVGGRGRPAARRSRGRRPDAPAAIPFRAGPGGPHALPARSSCTPAGCACPSWSSLPKAAARTRERFLIVRGKGAQGAPRAADRGGPRRARRAYLALLEKQGRGREPVAVPGRQRERAPDPAGVRARPEGGGGRGGPAGRPGQPARAAPRLRQPPAPERRRSARRPGTARATPTSRRRRSTPTCSTSG